jgi:hypothetical protein
MATENEEVKGLDLEDEPVVIFIKSHKGDRIFKLQKNEIQYSGLLNTTFIENEYDETWKSLSEDNPFLTSDASDTNMKIIVSYLKKCGVNGNETPAPPKPLPRDTLPNILKDDYSIFQELVESKESDKEKIKILSRLIMDITYFDVIAFREKACAVMASMFVGKPLERICTMVDYVEEKNM